MVSDGSSNNPTTCLDCGFEAPATSEIWGATTHIAMGEIPQCPECGSTTTTALSSQ